VVSLSWGLVFLVFAITYNSFVERRGILRSNRNVKKSRRGAKKLKNLAKKGSEGFFGFLSFGEKFGGIHRNRAY
jgi:hypothetical protein